jgi:acyl carrier protein phosphodiesterase
VGRYAPVLLDVVYDHLLADSWDLHTNQPIHDFADEVYAKLGVNRELFPERMQLFYDNMIKYRFLPDYGHLDGIEQTLIRLQMRAKTDVDFVAAIATMENEKGRLRDLFLYFFAQLQAELASKGYR